MLQKEVMDSTQTAPSTSVELRDTSVNNGASCFQGTWSAGGDITINLFARAIDGVARATEEARTRTDPVAQELGTMIDHTKIGALLPRCREAYRRLQADRRRYPTALEAGGVDDTAYATQLQKLVDSLNEVLEELPQRSSSEGTIAPSARRALERAEKASMDVVDASQPLITREERREAAMWALSFGRGLLGVGAFITFMIIIVLIAIEAKNPDNYDHILPALVFFVLLFLGLGACLICAFMGFGPSAIVEWFKRMFQD